MLRPGQPLSKKIDGDRGTLQHLNLGANQQLGFGRSQTIVFLFGDHKMSHNVILIVIP